MGQRQPRHRLDRMAHLRLRRAQELVPHRRVEEQIAHFDRRADRAADRARLAAPRRRRLPAPRRCPHPPSGCESPAGSPRRSTPAPRRENRASRRENKSSAERILLVAWLATASGSSSAAMPQPLSATRISSLPPFSSVTSIRVAPASTEFSSSSFTHARRPLDHLAGGDLVHDARRQLVDGGHEIRSVDVTNELQNAKCAIAKCSILNMAILTFCIQHFAFCNPSRASTTVHTP